MALPSGYTELEYILADGSQYINTGIIADYNTRVVCDFEVMQQSPYYQCIYGARGSTGNNPYALYIMANSTTFRSCYYDDIALPTPSIGKHSVDQNKNIVTMDGVVTTHSTSTFTSGFPLFLFAFNTGGTATDFVQGVKMPIFMVYSDAVLSAHYIPCKNANGIAGVYDLVSQTFKSSDGTSEFIAGPEIVPDYGVVALKAAQLTVSDNAIIALDLHVVDPVTGDPLNVTVNSVTGTVNGAAATWQLSGELWVTTVPLSELGQYLCVFDVATSDGKTAEMRLPLYYGAMSLITDRTQADVDELLSILQTPRALWTTEQAQLFYSDMSKGGYHASDLNRVGAAMVYIYERILSMGYPVASIAPKLYWVDTDTITQSDVSAYLADLAALKAVLTLPDNTPATPSDMERLTYTEANDIEQILTIINTMLTNITLAYMYAGELYGGEI